MQLPKKRDRLFYFKKLYFNNNSVSIKGMFLSKIGLVKYEIMNHEIIDR